MADGRDHDWLWPAAERAGLPIAMMAAGFLPKVGEVAQRHPNLKLILDHLGRPSGVTSPAERWANLPEVLALAKYQRGHEGHRREATPIRPTRSATFTTSSSSSMTPSAPRAGSGVPTSRACPARGASAWPCSPRSCPGSGAATSAGCDGTRVCDWLGWKR